MLADDLPCLPFVRERDYSSHFGRHPLFLALRDISLPSGNLLGVGLKRAFAAGMTVAPLVSH
jgi:hypothetical protein